MSRFLSHVCRGRAILLLAAVLSVVWLTPSGAFASPFRQTGYDTWTMAGANSDVAYGSSYGVVASNPALMSRFPQVMGVGVFFMKAGLKAKLMDRPKNADLAISMFDEMAVESSGKNLFRPLPTIELVKTRKNNSVDDFNTFLGLGGTLGFEKVKGLRLGGLIILPLIDSVDIQSSYADEREQYFSNTVHFARFGEWSPVVTGFGGISYSPPAADWLSVGVSLQATATVVANLELYIPDPQVQSYMLTNMGTQMTGKLRPIVGMQFEPLDQLAIGLTWKHWSYMEVDGSGNLYMYNYHMGPGEVDDNITVPKRAKTKFKMALDYEPMELSLAMGTKWKEIGLTGQLAVTWNHWSHYRDLHNQSPQNSAVYEPNNIGATMVNGGDYEWHDTVSFNAGISYAYFNKWFEAKLGGSYYPTPVPAQKGRTNYADSDVWCMALGHSFKWGPLPFYTKLGFQFWMMADRTTHKDPNQIRDEMPDDTGTTFDPSLVPWTAGLQTNNPGFPGYSVEGWLIVTNLSIQYEF